MFVKPNGSKLWQQQYSFLGRKKTLSQLTGAQYALATMCIGVGQGIAVALVRV